MHCQFSRTGILVDRARRRGTIAIPDREGTALLLASRRGRSLVGVLAAATRAGRAGHPKVGGAGVEVDGELLLVRADGDGASPHLILILSGQLLALALLDVGRNDSEIQDLRAGVERLATDVGLEVDQVLAVLAGE